MVQTGETATEVTIKTPQLSGDCQFLGQAITINNTGCEFVYHAGGTMAIESVHENVCQHEADPIELETPNCRVEWAGQTGLSGISYHNIEVEGEGAVTVEAKVENLAFNATGVDCPFGTLENGKLLTGNQIWRGTRPSGTDVGIEWTG